MRPNVKQPQVPSRKTNSPVAGGNEVIVANLYRQGTGDHGTGQDRQEVCCWIADTCQALYVLFINKEIQHVDMLTDAHKQGDSTRGHVDRRTVGDKTRSKKVSGKGILLVVAETRLVCM